MATTPTTIPIVWEQNNGRNGFDAPIAVGLESSVESRNLVLYQSSMGRKRAGSTSVPPAGLTVPIQGLAEFIPGQDPTAAEMYGVDSSSPNKIGRCAAGSGFVNMTLADNISSNPESVSMVAFNGKFFMAYHSGQNRVHVYDPGNASVNTVRRAGMGTPAAPTAANTGGAGSYATIRYYRIAFIEVRSGVTIRRSLLGPSLSFTPDGAHLNVTVTKPATISEGETHWEVYGSPDNVLFYALAANDVSTSITGAILVGTTTYVDSTAVTTYANQSAMPPEGQNTPFPSVKALGTDGKRLYGFGVWESSAGNSLAPKNGRFYYGPVLDSSGVGDDERISNTTTISGWIDISRNSNCVDRGITPRPVNNIIYAFQSAGVYGLIPTEATTGSVYRRVVIDSTVGSLTQQSIVCATDRFGQSCAFFLDPIRGPYIVGGLYGLKWCGKDVKDIWDTVNQDASPLVAWGMWHPFRSMVMFFVATAGSTTPNLALVCDVSKMTLDKDGDLRNGWTTFDGDFATARCGTMFSTSLSASRSHTRAPWVGTSTKLLRYDETQTMDDQTPYQAYVTSGARVVSTDALQLQRAYVAASAQLNVSLQQSLIRNFGDETTRTSVVDLSPVGSETTVLRKFGDAALQDAWAVQVQLGDAAAANSTFSLHQYRAVLQIGNPL